MATLSFKCAPSPSLMILMSVESRMSLAFSNLNASNSASYFSLLGVPRFPYCLSRWSENEVRFLAVFFNLLRRYRK